jgi:predicted PurR-regulated permease PerM
VNGAIQVFTPATGERIRRVGADCARSVTGYTSGNLLISMICGGLTYVVLLILGISFAGLIALFVGLADLVPLVGATIGGAVAVIAGFLHSTTAGLVLLGFFMLYQQLENHVLQPLIFARTVKLNPLTVIVAILLGVELVGVLGALLAIPVAGMIQVILRDIWGPPPRPAQGGAHRGSGAQAGGRVARRWSRGSDPVPAARCARRPDVAILTVGFLGHHRGDDHARFHG